jgi:peptidoglycan-N-acetylglucosamine deacetylase
MPRRRMLFAIPRSSGSVCLTFDDGPDPEATPKILDALKAADARATFFVQGSHAESQPQLIRRIHAEGHDIGHHSWSHGNPTTTSSRMLLDETVRIREFLKETVGIDSRLFRPPHGKLTAAKLLGLWRLRQTVVLWSYDPGDVFRKSTGDFLQWCDLNPPQAGDVVLLHDRAAVSVEGLPALLAGLSARGLRCSRVSDWVT